MNPVLHLSDSASLLVSIANIALAVCLLVVIVHRVGRADPTELARDPVKWVADVSGCMILGLGMFARIAAERTESLDAQRVAALLTLAGAALVLSTHHHRRPGK